MNERPQDRYNKKNTITYCLRLNVITDAEIIKELETKPSKNGYIKNLILKDIKSRKP